MTSLAQSLLRPSAVAIVGASADLKKNNSRPQRFLRKHGYTGAIYPINPGYPELFGEPCYPSLAAVAKPIDHAYVMVPTSAVEAVIHDCVAAKVRAATIFTGGFAESGVEGAALQNRIRDIARAGGVRLVGPNSLGVINTNWPLTLSANAVLDREVLPKGRTGLVSQSGSLIGALVSRGQGRGIGFSTLVSIGNEIDLSVGEIAGMMVEDPDTDVVLLFLETLRDPDNIARMAARARSVGKPVMAYVLGRSELGRELAQSHTGAMVGGGRALETFLDAHGIVRIGLFEGLIEAPLLVKGRKPASGKRVAVVTTTGGAAALVADHLGERGITVVTPDADLKTSLKEERLTIGDGPIIDLTMAGTRESIVDRCMKNLTARADVDAIVMVVGSSSETYPELAVKPLVKWAKAAKPIVAFLFPNAEASLRLLAEAGIAAFRTPEACADALAGYLTWRQGGTAPAGELSQDVAKRLAALATKGTASEQDALGVFSALGVEVVRSTVLPATGDVSLSFGRPLLSPPSRIGGAATKDTSHFPPPPGGEGSGAGGSQNAGDGGSPPPQPSPARGEGEQRLASHELGEGDGGRAHSAESRERVDTAALRYPVVAKVLSPDIAHKTDAGGVIVGIPDAAALEAARTRILASVQAKAPGARIDGILVQPMEKGLAEAIVGFRRDPQVGPVVMVGLGGTLAEIYEDFALRLAPVDEAEAARMIGEVKGFALLTGYRGIPEGDVAALARTIVAVSRLALATATPIAEAEINPVIVRRKGEGAVAVDGLIVPAMPSA